MPMPALFPFAIISMQVNPPPSPVGQEAALILDLSSALERARTNSPSIRMAAAKVAEREAQTKIYRSDMLPQFSFISDITRTRDVTQINGANPAAQATVAGGSSLTPTYNTFTTQAVISQPLFRWGQFSKTVQSARFSEKEAQFAARTTELDALYQTARAYLAALSAQADVDVIRVRLEAAERLRRDIIAKRSVQMATELDRLRAESEYESVRAESLKVASTFRHTLEVLNANLGFPPKTPLVLSDIGDPDIDWNQCAQPRSELSELDQHEKSLRALESALKAEFRPRLDFNAACGYQAPQSASLLKTPYDTWSVNLTLRIPLFDGLRSSAKVAQNRAQIEQVAQSKVAAERSIALELTSSERELSTAIAYRDSAEVAYQAAKEALRTSRESYANGLITSLDLLQAERSERQQERERRQARLNVWNASLALRRANGLPPL